MLRKALYASMFVVCGMVGGSAIAKPVKSVKTLVSAPYNGKKISKSGCTWANEGDITEAFNKFRNGNLLTKCNSQFPLERELFEKALSCLTDNDYFEVRSNPLVSRIAVMKVVLNRAKSGEFPKTICGVVYERYGRNHHRCQFSWVCHRNKSVREHDEYKLARDIARFVLLYNGSIADLTKGALYFHDNDVRKPQFTNNDRNLRRVYLRPHYFYYDKNKQPSSPPTQVAELPDIPELPPPATNPVFDLMGLLQSIIPK